MTQQNTDVQETTTVSAPTSQQVVRRTRVVTPAVVTESPQKEYETKKAIFRTYQVIWYILGIIEVVLAFRILLKLLGANSQSGFTSFIYAISNPFALPFAGILGITDISEMILEWSTLIAMAVYAIVAYGIVMLFQLIKPTSPEEVDQTVDNQ
ncbi:YggT family protein [Patescibacteria group bacterium]|nr:YggT family protein [Patescibacteria group bacterium]